MEININIPEVALDLTYDVALARHLVLAVRTLEMQVGNPSHHTVSHHIFGTTSKPKNIITSHHITSHHTVSYLYCVSYTSMQVISITILYYITSNTHPYGTYPSHLCPLSFLYFFMSTTLRTHICSHHYSVCLLVWSSCLVFSCLVYYYCPRYYSVLTTCKYSLICEHSASKTLCVPKVNATLLAPLPERPVSLST